jgi:hypothetical protein
MKPHLWRATIFSWEFMLSNFIWFNISNVLLLFNYWDEFLDIYCDFRIHVMIWDKSHLIDCLDFSFIKTLDIHCVSFYGYIWWFGLNRISFVICAKNGFSEWFNEFFKDSRTYIRFERWELRICIHNHENMLLWFSGCGFQNLSTFFFCFVFIYFSYVFFYSKKKSQNLELG